MVDGGWWMVMAANQKEGTLVNCFFCERFYITGEVEHPYGCSTMNFKSHRMPAVDIYNTTQTDCTYFVRKKISPSHGHHH